MLIEEKYLLVVQFVPENLMNKEHIHLHERYRIIILGKEDIEKNENILQNLQRSEMNSRNPHRVLINKWWPSLVVYSL